MSENENNIEKLSDNKLTNVVGGLYRPRHVVNSKLISNDIVRYEGAATIDLSKKTRNEHKFK